MKNTTDDFTLLIPSTDAIRKGWNEFSAVFANSYEAFYLNNAILFSDYVVKFFASNPNGRFLEIGCASGQFAEYLLKLNLPIKDYTFVDISEKMIELAQPKFESYHNIRVHSENAEKMNSIEDHSIDFIWAHLVLENVEDPRRMMQALRRIIAKNGRIFIAVTGTFEQCTYYQIWDHSLEEVGYKEPINKRPKYHLGNYEKCKELFDDSFFEIIEHKRNLIEVDLNGKNETIFTDYNFYKELLDNLSEERKTKAIKLINSKMENIRKNKQKAEVDIFNFFLKQKQNN